MHLTDRAKVYYAWHELGIVLNKGGLNPAHRKASLLNKEIWHGYGRSLTMLRRPPVAIKLRTLPTGIKLELKVKTLNLQDGPIVTNKGKTPRQTSIGPAPTPKEKFDPVRVYTYLDEEDAVANNHKYVLRSLKKKAGQWYEEYWLGEQDAKGGVHPGTKKTKDRFLRLNPLPALRWGQGYKESEEVAWPHPETYTFNGIDKPLDKISVGDITKYLSRKNMTQPKILKNWEKDFLLNPGWIREEGRDARARAPRPDRPHDSSPRSPHRVETSSRTVNPQEWIHAARATRNVLVPPTITDNYSRHILFRKLVIRRKLKAYGLDTTTHTRCRLCNRTSETLRHLDVCPVASRQSGLCTRRITKRPTAQISHRHRISPSSEHRLTRLRSTTHFIYTCGIK